MALPDLSRRLGTALVGATLFLTALWWQPISLVAAFALIAGFACWELASLTRVWHHRPPAYTAIPAFLLGFAWPLAMAFPAQPSTRWSLLAVPLIMLTVLLARPNAGNRQAARYALLGAVWVGLPLALISILGAGGDLLSWLTNGSRPSAEGGHQAALVTGVLVLIWSNDVGAYFTGSTLGRTKLAPSISPNKSWEGVIGGWILGMLIAFAFTKIVDGMPLGPWLGMATLTTIFGTTGDLLESRLKRRTGAKDSGTLLPGHGGFLDRFDSLLLVAPVAWLWFRVFFPVS